MEPSRDFLTIHSEDFNWQNLKPSMPQIIDWVRQCRNTNIKSFSEKHVVTDFFQEHFHISLSDRKYEFLSRELKELLILPVDLVHYSSIITELKESPGKVEVLEHCNKLVLQELTVIFKKYIF